MSGSIAEVINLARQQASAQGGSVDTILMAALVLQLSKITDALNEIDKTLQHMVP